MNPQNFLIHFSTCNVLLTVWQGVPKLFFLILDMTPVHHIDSMGLHFLEDLIFSTRAKGIDLVLANPNHKVRVTAYSSNPHMSIHMVIPQTSCPSTLKITRAWARIKLPELLGKENVFVSTHDAMVHSQVRPTSFYALYVQHVPQHALLCLFIDFY